MRFSLNQIRQYLDFDLPPLDELLRKIGAQLGAIETVEVVGDKYKGIIIAKVVSCVDHPDADRLHVCKVDDGGRAEGVERDENGHVQVVCGAPNVREGLLVAWLPPGCTVPESVGKEPFVLESRELRGVMSNGMLASPKELAIGDSHDGILEVDADVAPGADFAEAYNLAGDVIIDIENKMFTHRPDCFGYLGIARELAGIHGQPFKSPDWYNLNAATPAAETDELPLEVHNELPELVPRFMAVAVSGVHVGQSPVWLRASLARVGVRSVNNVVDLTNYIMLLTGQPLHAYDYDKVMALDTGSSGAAIVVRQPKPGEKLLLLNGKTIEPGKDVITIATRSRLIGLGGVMGGGETEVDDNTRNIILECAAFDMYSIRRTSMAHGLFTDAVTRFNKGQSPLQVGAVAARAVDEICRAAGGKVASAALDCNQSPERQWVHPPVPVPTGFINARLGLSLPADTMKQLLENVEFGVELTPDDTLNVTAPFWRTDIEMREDVVEEIGRLYGYDQLPQQLPRRDIEPAARDPRLELKRRVRAALRRGGANELLTYSFVRGELLDRAGQNRDDAFRLSNALSPELQYYRLSLTPSLLEKVHPNIKAGYREFAVFEMGKTHSVAAIDDTGLPIETDVLALVYTSNLSGRAGAAYYSARQYIVDLADNLGWNLRLSPLDTAGQSASLAALAAPYDPARSALISLQTLGQSVLGVVGEFRTAVRRQLKLPEGTAGFEIDLGGLAALDAPNRYSPLPHYPRVEQDISLKLPATAAYQEVYDCLRDSLDAAQTERTLRRLAPLDIYQRPDDPGHKQISFRFTVASYQRTLTDQVVADMLEKAAAAAGQRFGAERL